MWHDVLCFALASLFFCIESAPVAKPTDTERQTETNTKTKTKFEC